MTGSLRDSLQAIYDERGKLTPALVVEVARDEESPLHSRLEWDDSIAGEKYRLSQAKELIRSVEVVRRDADDPSKDNRVRYWHSVRQEDGHVFKPAEEIALDPVLSEIVKMDMRREWRSLETRYGRFAEFVAMVRHDIERGDVA